MKESFFTALPSKSDSGTCFTQKPTGGTRQMRCDRLRHLLRGLGSSAGSCWLPLRPSSPVSVSGAAHKVGP
ncbi:hypothetical protein GN956_G18668 [Arapaima gigas]